MIGPIPNAGTDPDGREAYIAESPRHGPEIHSAKAHRCVDHVKGKGHDESSAWAICTASIGKRGVYAKGHGGNANPKRTVKESDEVREEMDAVVAELEAQAVREVNHCHGSGPGHPCANSRADKAARGKRLAMSDDAPGDYEAYMRMERRYQQSVKAEAEAARVRAEQQRAEAIRLKQQKDEKRARRRAWWANIHKQVSKTLFHR